MKVVTGVLLLIGIGVLFVFLRSDSTDYSAVTKAITVTTHSVENLAPATVAPFSLKFKNDNEEEIRVVGMDFC